VRCAVYARVSIEREESGDNIEIQISECRRHIEDQGWTVANVFGDSDVSASPYSGKPRPGYSQLLGAVRSGDVECIVVTEMSRLYRRFEELLEVIHLAEIAALRRIETTDGSCYDLSTGTGIHNAVAAVNLATLESRRTSTRIKRKRRVEAQAGKAHGGIRPYGYEKGGMIIREHEARTIRECRDLILCGEPLLSVVRMLNMRGVPAASGGRWYNRSLEQILTSRRIAGVRVHGGAAYPATWPSIISVEDSGRLRLILRDRRIQKGRISKSYLLSNMIFCGLCGRPLISSGVRTEAGRSLRKYRCRHFDSSGNVYGCGKIVRSAEPVEMLVGEAVLSRCDSTNVASSLREAERLEITRLMDELIDRKTKLDNLLRDYGSGLLGDEETLMVKSAAQEAHELTREELARRESGRTLTAIPVDHTTHEAWEGADLAWRRRLIGLLVDKVIVHPSWPGGRRWQAPDGQAFAFEPEKIQIIWRM
jgi:DNA invertase Pin-like site-specific DNA recombinase